VTTFHRPVATLATVAAVAGVSRQTVSNALNNPELLRPETLARVQAAIEELGYRPNRAARNLRTRTSHLIGLRIEPTVEGAASGLMDRFLHSLVEASREAELHVLLFSPEDVSDPVDGYDVLLRSAAVDAFVVTDTYRGDLAAAWLTEREVPFVSFGRPWTDPGATHPWVDVDGRAGTRAAVDHLVERGHRRIGWIGWAESSYIGEDRRAGWHEQAEVHGLPVEGLATRGEDTMGGGREAAHRLLDAATPPTALLCVSDTMAMGALQALAERGVTPGPDGVGVVGFDDSFAAQVVPPGLTSVRQPLEEIAAELVRLLHDRLGEAGGGESGVVLTPTLRCAAPAEHRPLRRRRHHRRHHTLTA
jgi:DNA-binding LacI/PurR family transcriptional regulator